KTHPARPAGLGTGVGGAAAPARSDVPVPEEGIVMDKLKNWLVAVALAATLLLPFAGRTQDADSAKAAAAALLDALDDGDHAAVEAMLTAEMAAAVPADRLQAVWDSLPAQAGEAQGRGGMRATQANGAMLVDVPLLYAGAEL